MVRKASSGLKRRTHRGHGKPVEDGKLPDEILCHILSLLPTKDAVRTSILCKRWRYLWTSITSIDIDDTSLLFADSRRHQNRKIRACFMDFVDRVFRLVGASCLRKIRFNCDFEYDSSRISVWISTVISRNVEVLDLRFNWGDNGPELPPSLLLTCSKLVFLKLNSLHLLNIPTSVYLPSLKKIHLFYVELGHEDSIKNLLDGCPILEELDIRFDYWSTMKTLFVRSSSLKILRIDLRDACENRIHLQLGIVVDATNLEHLNLTCDVSEQCDLNSLSSLVEAKLDFCHYNSDSGEAAIQLLRKMSNIKHMCLYWKIMQTLEHAHLQNLPVFDNLVRLELHIYQPCWQALPYLLEKSPNIITIVLSMELASPYYEHEWHQQSRDPKCSMLYLENIQFISFKGCVEEMKMVSYFLKNAIALKNMSIQSCYSDSKDDELEILKKLLMFPRSSGSCQIEFN